jgi:cobalamin biosynthesis protein CobD/CbiB
VDIGLARCAPSPLAKRRLAGGGDGRRVYGGIMVDDTTMGDGRREANAEDIRAALKLYRRADAILIALVAALTLAVIALR